MRTYLEKESRNNIISWKAKAKAAGKAKAKAAGKAKSDAKGKANTAGETGACIKQTIQWRPVDELPLATIT